MKELDWIVNLLVDLHTFCERNGLSTLSDRVADAIEEAAPMIRGSRTDHDDDAETAVIAGGQILISRNALRGSSANLAPRLIYDAAVGTKQ